MLNRPGEAGNWMILLSVRVCSQLPVLPACREEPAQSPSQPAAPAAPRRPKPLRTCGQCGRQERGMLQCARCRAAWFCGVDCQRAAWPVRAVALGQRECICLSDAVQGGVLDTSIPGTDNTEQAYPVALLTAACRSTSTSARLAPAGSRIEVWAQAARMEHPRTVKEPRGGRRHWAWKALPGATCITGGEADPAACTSRTFGS